MAIVDIFSKRQKRLRGDIPDVYLYDEIPQELRVQIVLILQETLQPRPYLREYEFIVRTLRKEYGVFKLIDSENYIEEFYHFLLEENDVEKVLSATELSFQVVKYKVHEIADSAIDELNARFKEHGIGYEFVDRQIIRIDSEFIHAEVVKPALYLLNLGKYVGAQDEFLKAHEHYRNKRYRESIVSSCQAFESVMKTICIQRGWVDSKDEDKLVASKLIEICFKNQLIPNFLRSQFESGIPTIRNRMAAHGQGENEVKVSDYFAAYMLHLTASTIVFLAESNENLP